ncbi:MAG: putative acyl-CoA transferase/carnitine dehydratase [Pseudarthrobacter sp.]|nr:putative acyl-CoA transferase/carnitine dehydratase [Pseudarthrobacter sp.]
MQNKPLTGIRVLEFGGYIAAPYATSILAALGAEVVKVERPVTGEDFRRGVDDQSPYFIQYNGGKRSLAVDLKTPEGIALLKGLIPKFDVIVENIRPGKMDALGLGKADCAALRPDIVYVSVTGFGNGGPLSQRPAYDMIGQAFGGIISVMSDAGNMQATGTCLADLVTGLSTATGILAALVGRAHTPGAQHVETSIAEAVSAITVDAITQLFENRTVDPSRQTRHPQALTFCLKTAGAEFITVHVSSSQKFFESLIQAVDRPELKNDPRFSTYVARVENYFELAPIIAEEFLKKPAAEWERLLIEFDVPFSPVNTISQLRTDPQMQWLDLYEPERDGVSQVRPPWRFDGVRPARDIPAPKVGQHTRELAAEVYDDARIEELISAGILFAAAGQEAKAEAY